MNSSGTQSVFGRRKEPHTVIIARGDDFRHFTVRPWLLTTLATLFVVITVGYLFATTYLVLRDDLIGASIARQARMQQSYEDRISALRAQVDRITSRQMLDQQLVENKVGELLQRQSELTQRHKSLAPLLGDETSSGALPSDGPLPAAKPGDHAQLDGVTTGSVAPLAFAATAAPKLPFNLWSTRAGDPATITAADRADMMFVAINRSLRSIEAEQINKLDTLADNAYETAEAIGEAAKAVGFRVDIGDRDVGGPLLPMTAGSFDEKVKELDDALAKLDTVKKAVRRLPIASPAKSTWAVTSSFGARSDPFLGTTAFHAGIDFRAATGAPIKATAAGVVTKSGWNGGYGRLVEIDHGNGLTTRFGHMSRILVNEGDKVKTGDVIGEVGSSGRSTGPHLHYEVRKNGAPLDPLRFIKAGKRVDRFLSSL